LINCMWKVVGRPSG